MNFYKNQSAETMGPPTGADSTSRGANGLDGVLDLRGALALDGAQTTDLDLQAVWCEYENET